MSPWTLTFYVESMHPFGVGFVSLNSVISQISMLLTFATHAGPSMFGFASAALGIASFAI
jgi:hypothetical protein